MSGKEKYFYALTGIVTILSLYCIVYNLAVVGQIETYVPFTIPIDMNCNYYAILVGVSIVFLLDNILYSTMSKRKRVFVTATLFYLILTLFLLTSRSAIIVTFAMCVMYLLAYIRSTKKYYLLLIPVVSVFAAYLIFQNSRFGVGRLNRLVKSVKTMDYKEIFPKRFEMVEVSLEAISEKPYTGYGIEGAQNVLLEKYLKYNYTHQYKYNYHSHNQYLQWGLYGGIGLMLLLCVILIIPWIITDNKFLAFAVLSIFAVTFMTDAPLTDSRILLGFLTIVFFLSK